MRARRSCGAGESNEGGLSDDPIYRARARGLFFKHRDKDFSFTDCTSFAVMQELRLKRALTTDRHFRQMGFQVVPGAGSR